MGEFLPKEKTKFQLPGAAVQKQFAEGNPIASNTGKAAQSAPKSDRVPKEGFEGTLLDSKYREKLEKEQTEKQQKAAEKALPSEEPSSGGNESEHEVDMKWLDSVNPYESDEEEEGDTSMMLDRSKPHQHDSPSSAYRRYPFYDKEEEPEEEEEGVHHLERDINDPIDEEEKKQRKGITNMLRVFFEDFPEESEKWFPEYANIKNTNDDELYDLILKHDSPAKSQFAKELIRNNYQNDQEALERILGHPGIPAGSKSTSNQTSIAPLDPKLAPNRSVPYPKKGPAAAAAEPFESNPYAVAEFEGQRQGQVNGAFPPPDRTRVGKPTRGEYKKEKNANRAAVGESTRMEAERLKQNRGRGEQLGQRGEGAGYFGQAAGDPWNQLFFQRKGVNNAQGTGDLTDFQNNPANFGNNGQVQQGDPNRLDPITPATGAASQRADNPNSVKKTRDFEAFVKSKIKKSGPESVFGNAYDRTNAVGAGGNVNDWSNNGPFDYPDRKVDPTLGLVGAWRTKAGGANTLWTSYMNAKGTGLNLKRNKYYKYSQRRKQWLPIKGDAAVNDYMKKRNCRGNQIYGVPTGTRFSSLVSKLRKHKIKDIRMARSGGELMEMRKHSSIGMERKGLGTQK